MASIVLLICVVVDFSDVLRCLLERVGSLGSHSGDFLGFLVASFEPYPPFRFRVSPSAPFFRFLLSLRGVVALLPPPFIRRSHLFFFFSGGGGFDRRSGRENPRGRQGGKVPLGRNSTSCPGRSTDLGTVPWSVGKCLAKAYELLRLG